MIELDPIKWFSNTPGNEGVLISREDIRTWLRRLAGPTDRMRVETLGRSTEGSPIDAVFIHYDLAGNRLDELRTQRKSVVDALHTGLNPPRWSLPVVLITSGIHATEVGGPQSIPELVYWLVTSDEPVARAAREQVLVIVVPTLNPDGMDLVGRWNDITRGTERTGTPPPLLYHRFAGHDNNRDWLHRNLVETRVVLDGIHAAWMPHVTLDQHQMNAFGPRFVLPPYIDPWEPHIHPSIVAATSALGQAIATDLTLAGREGVATGRYFDAWEPSRAIQHYRGGVRILAEAASANLANTIDIATDLLLKPPLPMQLMPETTCPRPWRGGAWTLRNIVEYHRDAATSLLRHVSTDPDRWPALQREALSITGERHVVFDIPPCRPAIDLAANQRLCEILDGAGVARRADGDGDGVATWSSHQPLGPLLDALLLPKPYPPQSGSSAYDVTTHFLPMLLGATVHARSETATVLPTSQTNATGEFILIDARCHRAPDVVEHLLRHGDTCAHRATHRTMMGHVLVEPGTWIVPRVHLPDHLRALATGSIDTVPPDAVSVSRRDIVVLDSGEQSSADFGWTRWWLHERSIPFLEVNATCSPDLATMAESLTVIVPDSGHDEAGRDLSSSILDLISAGAHVIAFGAAGRRLATAASSSVSLADVGVSNGWHAPGALLRTRMIPGHPVALGLDRVVPVMFQRDGAFEVVSGATDARVLARFASGDLVASGWMSHPDRLSGKPAIVEVRLGRGTLTAFAFRPLFRGQTIVSSPLVHNLIYATGEPDTCLP